MELVQASAQYTYRGSTIRSELWRVNGGLREVLTVDGYDARKGHFQTVRDARRFIRHRLKKQQEA